MDKLIILMVVVFVLGAMAIGIDTLVDINDGRIYTVVGQLVGGSK